MLRPHRLAVPRFFHGGSEVSEDAEVYKDGSRIAEAGGRTEAVEDGEGTTGKTAFPRVSGRVVADNSEGGDRRHVRPPSRGQGVLDVVVLPTLFDSDCFPRRRLMHRNDKPKPSSSSITVFLLSSSLLTPGFSNWG